MMNLPFGLNFGAQWNEPFLFLSLHAGLFLIPYSLFQTDSGSIPFEPRPDFNDATNFCSPTTVLALFSLLPIVNPDQTRTDIFLSFAASPSQYSVPPRPSLSSCLLLSCAVHCVPSPLVFALSPSCRSCILLASFFLPPFPISCICTHSLFPLLLRLSFRLFSYLPSTSVAIPLIENVPTLHQIAHSTHPHML